MLFFLGRLHGFLFPLGYILYIQYSRFMSTFSQYFKPYLTITLTLLITTHYHMRLGIDSINVKVGIDE